jgi:hypothetical protein
VQSLHGPLHQALHYALSVRGVATQLRTKDSLNCICRERQERTPFAQVLACYDKEKNEACMEFLTVGETARVLKTSPRLV